MMNWTIKKIREFIENCVEARDAAFLYKYLPLRNGNPDDLSRIRSIIEKNVLYFSRLSNFNDPFDCFPIYDSPPDDFKYWIKQCLKSNKYSIDDLNKIKIIWRQGNKTTREGLIEEIKFKMQKYINEELGICCFSRKSDSLLMWSHYASFHTGVCFEFKKTSNKPFFGEALQVRYKPVRPKVNIFKRSQTATDDIFLTKSSDWRYESEYRIIGPSRKPGDFHIFPKECLIGIILGAKIGQENEITLRNIIEGQYPISIKKAKLDNFKYKINIDANYNSQSK